jgi:hypothetical protein
VTNSRRFSASLASLFALLSMVATRCEAADSVDLRPAFEKFGLQARAQGSRGTCSVFVVVGSVEYAASRQRHQCEPLSVEFLNWAANDSGGTHDDGANFAQLWRGCAEHGIALEAEMPYRDKFDSSLRPSDKAVAQADGIRSLGLRFHWIKEWDSSKGVSDEQFEAIKATLRKKWPVCGGFLWPKHEAWKGGVLQMCPRDETMDGHSVLLVGYRDDAAQPGGGVFLIRNSAGPARDLLLPYAYVKQYMNDAAWIGLPRVAPEKGAPSMATEPSAAATSDWLFRGPLGELTRPPQGRNRRVSSNESPNWQDGNMDMNWLQPGESVEVPLLEGPGVINHMWITSHAGWVNELNALSIRIYWDGRKEPGVEAPLGDFFAVGQGKPAVVESYPVQVSPTGALTCFWRMPFAKSARIVIRNDNPDRGTGLYWQIDWVKLDQLPPDTSYFHARYRQEYPAAMGRNYLLADLEGRGQYVGTVMSITNAQDGWFGEGDDFYYIDGEKVPSLQGTGTEDFFNDAWGFRPRTSHWFGSPRWQDYNTGDSIACYRWQVLDPVQFRKSLRVTIEHKGNDNVDTEAFYLERPDFMSSVAFWYQTDEPKAFGHLPPWPERRVPWQYQHFVRAFLKAKTTGPAKVEIQTQGFFGARPLLAWPNTQPGAQLTLPFAVDEDGRHAVRLTSMQGPNQGRYAILIDGKRVAERDFRAAEEGEDDLSLGELNLTKGSHEIAFEAVGIETPGKPAAAKPLAVEELRILKLPKKAVREVKTDNEAHFVRLAIGRSLYAYRLAYGKLPDSLETLVKVGIMPERYLRDENNLPLKAHCDGEYMNVESPAPNGWKYRWTGLDPRR